MHLEEFYDYKNKLMGDLLTNPEIVRLIDDDIKIEHAPSLMYSRVFPYEYVPETVENGYTFVCADVDIQSSPNKTYLFPVLYIWIFTHKSKLRLPEGGVRTDKLCSEVCKAINGSLKYGLGELHLYSAKRFAPMTDFQGKVLTFHTKDFNRQYNPTKDIPVNRKQG